MGIKHKTPKESGEFGYASEWNAEHIIDSDINFNSFSGTNIGEPINPSDIATKNYVDMMIDPSILFVDPATGNVGIGTTSPDYKLEISDANAPILNIIDTTNNVSTFIQSSNTVGSIGTLSDHALQIKSNNTNAIFIDTSQNVGIGTTSPTSRLYVNASAYNGVAMIIDRLAAGGVPSIQAGPSNAWLMLEGANTIGNVGVNFYSSGDVILAHGGGDVGIGTTAPKSKLHVVGLPVFTNNAAAIAGGLTAGAFYRTGADPDPVYVVH